MQKHKQLETEAENMEWESLNRALTQKKSNTNRQKSMTTTGFGMSQRGPGDNEEPVLGESIYGDK
jgi:hypothetical protein